MQDSNSGCNSHCCGGGSFFVVDKFNFDDQKWPLYYDDNREKANVVKKKNVVRHLVARKTHHNASTDLQVGLVRHPRRLCR